MKRALEPFVFVSLAFGLHMVLLVGSKPDEGADASGAEGTELVSIQASSASIETMVERWSEPPSARPPDQMAFESPQAPENTDLPDVPAPSDFAFQTPSVVGLAIPSAPEVSEPDFSAVSAAPTLLAKAPANQLQALEAPASPSEQATAIPTMSSRPTPSAPVPTAPVVPVTSALPQAAYVAPVPEPVPPIETAELLSSSARPMKRPDRPQPQKEPTRTEAPKRADAPSQSSVAQSRQTAAGQGGGGTAGATASAETATLAPSREASLVARWGGRVRAQIERRKRYPNSARGADGTTRLAVTISRTGQLIGTRITKTSGNTALDSAAVAAVKASRRYAKAPNELPQKQVTFNLSISFEG